MYIGREREREREGGREKIDTERERLFSDGEQG